MNNTQKWLITALLVILPVLTMAISVSYLHRQTEKTHAFLNTKAGMEQLKNRRMENCISLAKEGVIHPDCGIPLAKDDSKKNTKLIIQKPIQ